MESAKHISSLVKQIQNNGGVLLVENMATTGETSEPGGSQSEPVETPTAPDNNAPPSKTRKGAKTQKTDQAKKSELAKAKKEAEKVLAAQERARLKAEAEQKALEEARVSNSMTQIEEAIKNTGVHLPETGNVIVDPAPTQVVTAPPTPSVPVSVPRVKLPVAPAVTQVVNTNPPAQVTVSTTPAPVPVSTVAPQMKQTYHIPKKTAVTAKVTQSITTPRVAAHVPNPPDSIAHAIESSTPAGMKSWVSEPDQNGWKKFDDEIVINGGFKSTIDGKIYRVRVIAENHGKKTKGIITCHNQVWSVLADADLLPDPGVNIVDPNIVVPAGDEVCHFPDDAPAVPAAPKGHPTVHNTTAAVQLINSVPVTAAPAAHVVVATTLHSVNINPSVLPPVISAPHITTPTTV